MNPKNRFTANDLLRHKWFYGKASKEKENYQFVPKPIFDLEKQELLKDQKLFLDQFFNDNETVLQNDLWKIIASLFSLRDIVYYFRILDENQEQKLIYSEIVTRPNPIKDAPFFIDNTNELIYNDNKNENKYFENFLALDISNLLILIKNEILKFYNFKKANPKDFSNIFLQNLKNLSKNVINPTSDESIPKTNSGLISEKENETKTTSIENIGKRLLNKVNFGSKFSRLFTSKASTKSSGEDKEKSKALEEDSLVYFSAKIQIHLFYSYCFNSLSNQKKNTNTYSVFYKLPMPENLRLDFWKKILEMDFDTSQIFSFLSLDNNIYSNKTKILSQIESDIPRCHQYHPLLNSYHGKLKLYDLLISVMNFDKSFNYIQGLDSMGTVVLDVTRFQTDVSCVLLSKIIEKTIKNFINTNEDKNYVKEYLLMFQWILFFAEPVLAKHLLDIGFLPELYAVSWILNLFSSNYICFYS